MSKKQLLALFLFFSSIAAQANGHPGDDIWVRITQLSNGIGTNAANIQQIRNDIETLFSMFKSNNAKIQKIITDLEALKSDKAVPHHLGETYRGGLVFYVDESGQHGLIASKIDVSEQGVQWRNGVSGNKVTNARGDGIGAGETNTRLIISQQTVDNQNGSFAALQAANFQVLDDGVTPCKTPVMAERICYGGWYLPSAFELQLLHTNLHDTNISSFAPEFYWSSTEAGVANAWLQNFSTGEITASSKSSTIGRVRAITRF